MRDAPPTSQAALTGEQRVSPASMLQRQLPGWQETALAAITTGTVTSIVTTVALALLARSEGKSIFQPTNATSHWIYGENAGRVRSAEARHTLLGYCTHHLSAIFWAVPFQVWLAVGRSRAPSTVTRKAALIAALAALVDYGFVPKRLTPGWEAVISKRSIAAAFIAMALGLALGGMMSPNLQRRGERSNTSAR